MNPFSHFSCRCMNLIAVVLLMTASQTSAQKWEFGGCPNYVTQVNFNLNLFLGTWYEAEKYPIPGEVLGRCVTSRYSQNSLLEYRIFNQQITAGTNQEDSIYGYVTWADGPLLLISMPTFPFYQLNKYWVLETDYINYAIIHSCNDYLSFFRQEYVWILTRARHPYPEVLADAYRAMDSRSMNRSYLRRTQQNGCEDYTG